MKQTIKLVYVLMIFLLSSCEEKKIENYTLNIIQLQPLDIEEGSPLEEGLKQIINYSYDTANTSILYMPKVIVKRLDFESEKTDSIIVPLNPLNKWRKSVNMIAPVNLIEDYDENIPKLITPKILVEKGNKQLSISQIENRYPNAVRVLINDDFSNSLTKAKREILQQLKSNKRKIDIIFYADEEKTDTTGIRDTEESKETSGGKNEPLRTGGKKDKVTIPDKYYEEQAIQYETKLSEIKNKVSTNYKTEYNSISTDINKLRSEGLSNSEKDQLLLKIIDRLFVLIEKINTNPSSLSTQSKPVSSPIAEQYYNEAKILISQARAISDNKKSDREKKKDLLHKAVMKFENANKNGKNCKDEQFALVNEFKEYFPK